MISIKFDAREILANHTDHLRSQWSAAPSLQPMNNGGARLALHGKTLAFPLPHIRRSCPKRFFLSIAVDVDADAAPPSLRRSSGDLATAASIASALKSVSSHLPSGLQLHAAAIKSGADPSDVFVRNALINLYSKCGLSGEACRLFASCRCPDTASWNIMLTMLVKSRLLWDARELFDEMPERDCVSFTTMIMGFAQNGREVDAVGLFPAMVAAGVMPNEVTLSSVLSACARLRASPVGEMVHGMAGKCGIGEHVLVATNLIHFYAAVSDLDSSRRVFDEMPDRNTVTWNAMLNGYAKSGRIGIVRDLFDEIPSRDAVSWGTMIDGCLRADRKEEALIAYRGMLRDNAASSPNEVMLVNLLSACGRLSGLQEGIQLHATVLKSGLDSHAFVQATLVHFYASAGRIEFARLQFESSDKENISSWNAIVSAHIRAGSMDSARHLFDEMPERDVVSWSTMIAGYARDGRPSTAIDLFLEMKAAGIRPNEITLMSILSVVGASGTLDQGTWIHRYIEANSIRLAPNLSAALINMYAKHGRIKEAMNVFYQVPRDSAEVSPWNAIICGLAMHGHAELSLDIFSDMSKSGIRPNSITFVGVLSACCHAGFVEAGRYYLESMRSVYGVEPNIKHYGCVVDLLGRVGLIEEAEQLVRSMPMEADVRVWGSLLAASRTHGNVAAGERAAERLERLDPMHGGGRVLLSNVYADLSKWSEVSSVRMAMQSRRLIREHGYSGVAI